MDNSQIVRNKSKILAKLDKSKARYTHHVMEVLDALYRRMPIGETISLPDGKQGVIQEFYEPKVGIGDKGEREYKAGVDVVFTDGSHLEFTIELTGWGGIPVEEET
jgi:hypothetical protein